MVVTTGAGKGKHVRRAGLDFARGAVLLAKGRRLTDRDLALAAAMNHPTVPVHRAPKVAVLATGDELVMPGASPGFGEIVYSNGYATHGAGARAKAARWSTSASCPIASPRPPRPCGARAISAPTSWSPSGGASVGDYDLVQKALAAEGLALRSGRWRCGPGRPMMHGRLGAMHVLGLPGNPVSAYVCAVLFLVPLIRRLAGRADVAPQLETGRLGCDLPANDERADYLRATLAPAPTACLSRRRSRCRTAPCWPRSRRPTACWFAPPHAPAATAGEPLRLIVKLGLKRLFRDRSTCSPQIKWLRNTYGTYSVRS